MTSPMKNKGILLIDKSAGSTSFQIVHLLRRLTQEKTIGHAGTLDPFATGVMVLLIGREYTRKSEELLSADKQYRAIATLGRATDTFDIEGQTTFQSDLIPTKEQVDCAIAAFQGEILQMPPMFSAKKIQGKKLCDLARRGITVERQPVQIKIKTTLLRYEYPELEFEVSCSKGTYIRSVAEDLGKRLGCGAHLSSLCRTRSGSFHLKDCIPHDLLKNPEFDVSPYLIHSLQGL